MMSELDTRLTALADAIRAKTGATGKLSLEDMANAISTYKKQLPPDDTGFISGDIVHFQIPDGVTSIKDYAFWGCSALKSIIIPASVTSISTKAFEGCSALESLTLGMKSITEVFRYNKSLKYLTLLDSVKSIGANAFYDCESITSVTLGNGVTSIGDRAFQECSALKSIIIPASVTSIGAYAFKGCTSLRDIYCRFPRGAVTGASWGAEYAQIHYDS